MEALTLQEIQSAEYSILVAFDELCKKNQLKYTLCGGTMLGAIRHNGFIPWDDDIDLMMPRPDFDRLLNMVNIDTSGLPAYMTLSNWKIENGEPFPFIKLLDTRYKVVDRYSHADSYLWIDIFPIDACPDDEKQLVKLCRKLLFERKILLIKNAKSGEGKSIIKKFIKPLFKMFLAPVSTKRICDNITRTAKTFRYEDAKTVGAIAWGYGPGERFDKDGLIDTIQVRFETGEYPAPKNYDAYLTGIYGDYMTPPPLEKRNTRHDVQVFDCSKGL